MKRISIIALVIGLISQIGFAQSFNETKLDIFFAALEANNKFIGSVAEFKEKE